MANSRVCSIPNCGKPHIARGFCHRHWKHWRLACNPDDVRQHAKVGEPQRYYQETVRVYDGDECLLWPFSQRAGYGIMWHEDRYVTVSRLICEETHGQPPNLRYEAAHSCGKGHLGCVTKRHLSWKTHRENQRDRSVHGTDNRGPRNGRWKDGRRRRSPSPS